ncbi:hypothetical protein [Nocardia gipuzkoensis]|uniref:hypothetical protein n=1 Tax=Nocardia gipuzkoensis TaxID=2749991 RepID=UPI003EE12280
MSNDPASRRVTASEYPPIASWVTHRASRGPQVEVDDIGEEHGHRVQLLTGPAVVVVDIEGDSGWRRSRRRGCRAKPTARDAAVGFVVLRAGRQTQVRQIVPQNQRFRSAEPLEISLLPIACGSTGA